MGLYPFSNISIVTKEIINKRSLPSCAVLQSLLSDVYVFLRHNFVGKQVCATLKCSGRAYLAMKCIAVTCMIDYMSPKAIFPAIPIMAT